MPSSSSILTLALAATLVQSQQPLYAQCGGIGYTGATTCASGSTCTIVNPYYSQCLPGSAPSSTLSTITTTSRAPVPPTSTTSRTTSVRPTTTNPSLPSGTAGAGPGTALQSGYFWIRAVEDPNFHKYLQSVPDFAAGVAVLDAPSGAGQFNVVDGQLVELVCGFDLLMLMLMVGNGCVRADMNRPTQRKGHCYTRTSRSPLRQDKGRWR